MNHLTNLKVKLLSQNATLPTRNLKTDAGIDLYASEDVFIPPGTTKVVKTDVAIQVPEGFVGKIEDRSGLASKGLRTGGGVVDCGYAGEVKIVMHNISNSDDPAIEDYTRWDAEYGYRIKAGDKIAQILLYKVETPNVEAVKELCNSERKASGFGSSGR